MFGFGVNNLPIESLPGQWLKATHHHCKCGGEITFLGRLPWKPGHGVGAIGVCLECDLLFVESEHTKPKWIHLGR